MLRDSTCISSLPPTHRQGVYRLSVSPHVSSTCTPASVVKSRRRRVMHVSAPHFNSWGQLVPAGASWYNTLKLASCHVHRPCLNPLQSPHRVITSKQESSTSLASQFGKLVKCYLYD